MNKRLLKKRARQWVWALLVILLLFGFYSCEEEDTDSCYCDRCCQDYEYFVNNIDFCYEQCGSFYDDCGCK